MNNNSKYLNVLVKVIAFFMSLPFIILLFAFLGLTGVMCYLVSKSTFFIGLLIIFFSLLLIMFSIVEALFMALFETKIKISIPAILTVAAISFISGIGIFTYDINKLESVDVEYGEREEINRDFNFVELMAFYNNYDGQIKYVIDNNMDKVNINIVYDKKFYDIKLLNEGNNHYINGVEFDNFDEEVDLFVSYVEKGFLPNFDTTYPEVTVTSNETNIRDLIKNASFVKHITTYKEEDNIIKVYSIRDVYDDEKCILNEKNYYDCK